ncbi:histidine phosphatase superfamily [Amylostereum chailletii]|nr:histidine phosphatase superfamily [Amylostereum chailletii]
MATGSVIVYIVRHGETAENRGGVIQGQKDTTLNEEGRRQAERVGERFAREGVRFERVWTSDLRRTVETMERILEKQVDGGKAVPVVKSAEMRERCMGKWEGVAIERRRQASKREAEGGESGVESVESVSRRAAEWWEGAIGGLDSEREREVLVVSHGYWISVLVRGLIGSGRVAVAEGVSIGKVGNTAVAVIVVDGEGKGVLKSHGDVGHLGGQRAGKQARNADAEVEEPAPAPLPSVSLM